MLQLLGIVPDSPLGLQVVHSLAVHLVELARRYLAALIDDVVQNALGRDQLLDAFLLEFRFRLRFGGRDDLVGELIAPTLHRLPGRVPEHPNHDAGVARRHVRNPFEVRGRHGVLVKSPTRSSRMATNSSTP